VDESGQNDLLNKGDKRKKNRSKCKNRKSTVIKLTNKKNPKKSMEQDEQTNKKQNKPTKKLLVQEQKNFSLSLSSGFTPPASSPGVGI
jgi:hypothetical protein